MKKTVETHWYCKSLLCSAIFAISLVAFATSAMAFGGGGKSRKSAIYKGTGVDSVGVHVGPGSTCSSGYDKIRNKCFKSCENTYKHDKDGSCTVCAQNEDGTTNAYLSYKDDPCGTATPLDTSCRTDCYCCNSGTCASWEWDKKEQVVCNRDLPTCTSNSDCSDGEYCNLNSTIKNQGNAVPNIGTCLPIGEKTTHEYNNNGFVASVNRMSWWAAENWCKAQGLELAELADIGFDKDNAGSHFANSGSCSGTDDDRCRSGDWSAIQKAFNGVTQQLWTRDQYKTTHEYAIQPSNKAVDFWFRYSSGTSALCKAELKGNKICNIYNDCTCTAAYTGSKCTECAEGYEKDENGKCVLSCPADRMCDGVCCEEGSTCNSGECCMKDIWGDYTCCESGKVAYSSYLWTLPDKEPDNTISCCYGTSYIKYGSTDEGFFRKNCCPTHSGAKIYCAIRDENGSCTSEACCTGTVKEGEGFNGADECFAITGCMSNNDCSSNQYCHLTGESCEYPDTGVCKSKGSYSTLNVSDLGTVLISDNPMTWWAADNWCKAQGRSLISMADLGCYYERSSDLLGTGENFYKTWYGPYSGEYDRCFKKNSTEYSNQIISIWDSNYSWRNFWTNANISASGTCYVYHFTGLTLAGTHRNRGSDPYDDSGYGNNVYAMCK